MSIPENILPPDKETPDQKKNRERWEAVVAASNAMMTKATACKKKGVSCCKCTTLCDEMKEWERVADAGETKEKKQ